MGGTKWYDFVNAIHSPRTTPMIQHNLGFDILWQCCHIFAIIFADDNFAFLKIIYKNHDRRIQNCKQVLGGRTELRIPSL